MPSRYVDRIRTIRCSASAWWAVAEHYVGDQMSARRPPGAAAGAECRSATRTAFVRSSAMSFASALTCASRRACSWRGCCGCRDSLIRRAHSGASLTRRRRAATPCRNATSLPWRRARLPSGWETRCGTLHGQAGRAVEKACLAALDSFGAGFERRCPRQERRLRWGIARLTHRPRMRTRSSQLLVPDRSYQLAEALARPGGSPRGWPRSARCRAVRRRFLAPELIRLQAELNMLQATTGAAEASEDSFGRRSIWRGSKEPCPGSCVLRRASPACCGKQGRLADAIACLQPIYDRFTEGFGTADLIAAKQLLDDLSGAGRR